MVIRNSSLELLKKFNRFDIYPNRNAQYFMSKYDRATICGIFQMIRGRSNIEFYVFKVRKIFIYLFIDIFDVHLNNWIAGTQKNRIVPAFNINTHSFRERQILKIENDLCEWCIKSTDSLNSASVWKSIHTIQSNQCYIPFNFMY